MSHPPHHNRHHHHHHRRPHRPGGGGGGGGFGGGGGGQRDQRFGAEPRRSDAEKAFLLRTPLTPNKWIRLERGSTEPAMRAVDLLSPIGKGQRGLIVAPPKTGKTTILKQLCVAAHEAEPNMEILCLLVDERPEEVTDFKRSVPAEVFASSSDRAYDEHIRLAETVYQKGVAGAAAGKDVMIVVDSLTRLSRVHNTASGGNRTMSGGLDSRAMEVPRRFFGAARNLEEGGSLTIIATILVDTGSRMDEVIFQEFKGTGNMELVLSRPAAEARLFPAIHVKNSGTRREELLLPPETLDKVWKLRRTLAGLGDLEATRSLVDMMRRHTTNERLLQVIDSVR